MLHLEHIVSFILQITTVRCFLIPPGKVSVNTSVGEIVGFTTILNIKGSHKILNTFLGIPYAEPPTGTRRFRKPVPKAVFTSSIDASKYGPACYQILEGQKSLHNVSYSEDCLHLNIFAPGQRPSKGRYPVMIYIHGGGFIQGYSNGYEAGYFSLSGEVIVVTINYRLNVFGFLSTGDHNYVGNYALWDQHLAIKWVYNNIQAFGGDPTRITLFGQSAGAACVTYQASYPGNRGLIQRAVAESGSFAGPWALLKRNDAQKITRQFAIVSGCLRNDSHGTVSCLQSKPAKEIKAIMDGSVYQEGFYTWKPVVDNEFVLGDPKALLTNHSSSREAESMFLNVDLIIGVNSKEGFSDFPTIDENSNITFTKSDIDNNLLPHALTQFQYFNKTLPESVKDAVILEYTDWNNVNDIKRQFDRFVDMITDYWMSAAAAEVAVKHTTSPSKHTYVYKLSTAPPRHVLPVYAFLDGPTVANHADDVTFLFAPWFKDGIKIPNGINKTITNRQIDVGKAMVTMWTNFAKSGYVRRISQVIEYPRVDPGLFNIGLTMSTCGWG